jgi:hypothetical protein
MVHEDYKQMLALHALDALEGAEVRELDVHLTTCAECRTELEELRDASGLMAYAADQLEPSIELRSRIMAQIGQGLAASTPPAERQTTATGSENSRANVIPLTRAPRERWSFAQTVGAIAAGLAFIALAISTAMLWNRNSALQSEVAQLAKQKAEQQEILAREREMTALLTAKDSAKFELAGTPMAQDAHATLAFNRKTGHAMLMVNGLPAAPAGKAYQLWFIAGGRAMPGKVFNVDAQGKTMMIDDIPMTAREQAVFAVTLEPQEGVTAPTGQKYLISAS